jgi:hypothetical protein
LNKFTDEKALRPRKGHYITLIGATIGATLASISFSFVFVFAHPIVGIGLAFLPVILSFSYALSNHRNTLLCVIVAYSFIAAYIGRLYPDLPVGVVIDLFSFILLTNIIFYRKDILPINQLKLNITVVAMFTWFAMTMLQLFNPYATEYKAWFTANRYTGIYPLAFTIFSILLFYKSNKSIKGGCQHLANKTVRSSTERSSIAVSYNQNATKKLPSPPRGGSSHHLSYA